MQAHPEPSATPDRRPTDPDLMRVSDDDRHRVAELLREAAGEGRLDVDELDERLETTYAARTYADLVPLTSDLPAVGQVLPQPSPRPALPAPVPGAAPQRLFAVLSGVDRRGSWVVPERLTLVAFMGGAHLDLRHARFAAREVVVTVNAFMGGASVVVGPTTNVVIEGIGIMGGYAGPSGVVDAGLDTGPDDSSPTVRVRGVAVWGGVSVERRELDDDGPRRGLPHHGPHHGRR